MSHLSAVAHIGNYSPDSFGWGNEKDPESHPRQLVPLVWRGHNFGLCHREVHALWMNLLDDLVPHIPHGLRNGQLGCYVARSIAGSSSRSFHSWGIAIDINWGENPMHAPHHTYGSEYVLPPVTHDVARRWGCEWGADWSNPDWMHIECHLSPAAAHTVRRHRLPTLRFRVSQVMQAIHRRRWAKKKAGR